MPEITTPPVDDAAALFSKASILSRNSKLQLRVAVLLLAIIPLLSLGFILLTMMWPMGIYQVWSRIFVVFFTGVIAVIGYTLLQKYPRNIERLRMYLREIAEGELPDSVTFSDREDDIRAIERYLNTILGDLRSQVKQLQNQLTLSRKMQETIESQADEIIAAERQRVMIESMGAACHHIGQPATVLRMALDSMKKSAPNEEFHGQLENCLVATSQIAEILDKLRRVTEYRTVPYQTFRGSLEKEPPDHRILDIEPGSEPEDQVIG